MLLPSKTDLVTSTACPVCQAPVGSPTFEAKERQIGTCSRCGLQFVVPLTSDAVVDAMARLGDAFLETYLREERSYRAYFRQKVADLQRLTGPGRLLDVGCATGVFLDEARQAGWHGVGLDLMPQATELARSRFAVDARMGGLEEMCFRSGEFDVVSLFQVIEHVVGPADLAAEVARVLKPGGLLLVTTPDRRGFMARMMGRRWFEYYNEEHVTFFTGGSLRQLLSGAGFNIIRMSTEFGRVLSLSYAGDRLSDFYYTDRSVLSGAGRFVARLLKAVGGVQLREPWQSLYAIARRV